jgi:catechol 2,3-dioxygenase-like lactoylglutathione lyase family enzyme
MASMIDSLFDRYDRGGMTRRQLVQALAAAVAWPAGAMAQTTAPAPIVRGVGVNHVQLNVSDVARSKAFYTRIFGVTPGWPTANAATGIHLDLADGYISVTSGAATKGIIGHFAVGVDRLEADDAKGIAAKINSAMPEVKATASFQENDGVWTVNFNDPDGIRVQISRKDGK